MPGALVLLLLTLPAAVVEPLALVAGLLVALAVVVLPLWSGPSADTEHYRTGADGEREVGRRLQELVDRRRALQQGAAVMHDRRLPGRDENVDHVLVSPAGVTVVETKTWGGRLRSYRGSLYAGRRSSVDKAAAQATRQAAAVRTILRDAGLATVPVQPVVCLVGQARPRTSLVVDGVTVCGADQLWTALPSDQRGDEEAVRAVAWVLDAGFPVG